VGVSEGSIVFDDEPLLEVTAPIADAKPVETYLLNECTSQIALATKPARCLLRAGSMKRRFSGSRVSAAVGSGVGRKRCPVSRW
jgi:nicotinate phosphoribosyltransferase